MKQVPEAIWKFGKPTRTGAPYSVASVEYLGITLGDRLLQGFDNYPILDSGRGISNHDRFRDGSIDEKRPIDRDRFANQK